MTLDEVITLPRLREMLGGVGDSEDDRLTQLRAAAVRVVEDWTGRHIVDKAVTTEDFIGLDKPTMCYVWRLKDANASAGTEIVLHYKTPGETLRIRDGRTTFSIGFFQSSNLITIDRDIVRICLLEDQLALDDRVSPILTFPAGMVAADLPASFPEAVGVLVRMFYEGSGFDPLPPKSTLSMILGAHRKPVE